MIKAVIFDIDGVMVITEQNHYRAWKKFCEGRGIKLKVNYYLENLSGHRSQEILLKLLGRVRDFDRLTKEKEAYFREIAEIKPVTGLYNVLKNLREKYKIGVATSIPRINIDFYLKDLKIKEFTDALVIGDDVKEGKPNPEIYLKTAKKLSVKPEECVVIEDSRNGLSAAKNAGMTGVIVLNDFNKKFNFKDADFIVDNIKKIEGIINSIGGQNG